MFIREQCQCDFQEQFISSSIIDCDEQTPTKAVYRANISSYTTYSTEELIRYIQDWGAREIVIQTQMNEDLVVINCVCPIMPNATITFDDICVPVQVLETTEVINSQQLILTNSSIKSQNFTY